VRHGIFALIIIAVLMACHRGTADQTSYMRHFAIPSVSPLPGQTEAPTFAALDAGRPGQPELTEEERAEVRAVLREVRPCQRQLVRYAVLTWAGGGRRVPVFFAVEELNGEHSMPHVFGSHNEIYMPDGEVVAFPDAMTDRQAIAIQQCAD
jgi:hypothetical protein